MPHDEQNRATTRTWLGLAVIVLPCLLYSMDFTVLHLAVPALSAALHPTSTQLLWIVDIYGFMLAGSLLTMGVLGDRIGRRKLLLIGAAFFGAASLLAAFATTAPMLIAARALLGVAAATLAPSTLSLIRNMFANTKQRSIAIGIWVASFSAGAALGPLLGGVLLNHYWWGSVFLIAIPVMLGLLIAGPKLLPEYRDPDAGKIDLVSAGLSLAAVLLVIYAAKQLAATGMSALVALSFAFGLILAVTFVRRQKTLASPFMDLTLFRSRLFSGMLALYTLVFFVGFGAFFFLAQYLQLVLGMDALQAGLWTLPWAIAQIFGSLVSPWLAQRFAAAYILAGGLVLAALGFGLLTVLHSQPSLAVVVLGSTMFSLGLIPFIALTTDMIIGAVRPERAGLASGLSETASELGGALGIAFLGSVATAIYRHEVAQALPPSVPPGLAAVATDTLGGALGIASELPGDIGQAVIAVTRSAFSDAAAVVFGLCAIFALAAAILTRVVMAHQSKKAPRA